MIEFCGQKGLHTSQPPRNVLAAIELIQIRAVAGGV